MSGFAFMVSPCAACGRTITYNPVAVPSIRVNGVKEPLCRPCANLWNKLHRIDKGLPAIPILPDAYEACPEEEL